MSNLRSPNTKIKFGEEFVYGTEISASNSLGDVQSLDPETTQGTIDVRGVGSRNKMKVVDGPIDCKFSLDLIPNNMVLLQYALGTCLAQPAIQGDETAISTAIKTAYTAGDTTISVDDETGFVAHDVIEVYDATTALFWITKVTSTDSDELTISPAMPIDFPVDATVKEIDGTDMTAASLAGAAAVTVRTDATVKLSNDDVVVIWDDNRTEIMNLDDVAGAAATTLTWEETTADLCQYPHASGTLIYAITGATAITTSDTAEAVGAGIAGSTFGVASETDYAVADYAIIMPADEDTTNGHEKYPFMRKISAVDTGELTFYKGIPRASASGSIVVEHQKGCNVQLYMRESDLLPYFTIERNTNATTDNQELLTGCMVDSWSVACEQGGLLKLKIDGIAQVSTMSTDAATAWHALCTAAERDRQPWKWSEGTISYSTNDGSTWTAITSPRSFSLDGSNNLIPLHVIGTNRYISKCLVGNRDVDFKLTIIPTVSATFLAEALRTSSAGTPYWWKIQYNRAGYEYDSVTFIIKDTILESGNLNIPIEGDLPQDLTWKVQESTHGETMYVRIITQNPDPYVGCS